MAELLQSLTALGEAGYFTQVVLDAFQKRTGREKADSQLRPWLKMTANAPEGKMMEVENLTRREMEIIALLADGLKNKEIADRLYLSPTTIKKHIYNIYQKWDVHSRISVVTRAREKGIIS
jgi:DNA-binding NarL/FixJ family response regulator